MSIPELLREAQERKGYPSLEEMAWQESLKSGRRINPRTLYSWMTDNPRYARTPTSLKSFRTISEITGRPVGEIFEMVVGADSESVA